MRVLLALTVVLALGCSKKEIGQPCEEASECEFELCQLPGGPSRRSTCTKFCDDSSDCPDQGSCVGGSCQAACSSQKDCPEETLCSDGLCMAECRSDADCINATCPAPGQVCEQ